MIERLDHLVLTVADIDTTVDFYQRVLGMDREAFGEERRTALRFGGQKLNLRPETATRLVDALAVLLVRLHLSGFFWGDVSLSNTLFRRDAGAFAAYLVDAETGELVLGTAEPGALHDAEDRWPAAAVVAISPRAMG